MALSVVLSVVLTTVILDNFSGGIDLQGLAVSIAMPILLGTPMMALFLTRNEQLRHANEQLQKLASIDWLTGCLNRRVFTTRVSEMVARPRKRGALLVIDADHFKAINDRHGHDRGDDALRLIADTIAGTLDGEDLLGRLGGEEFGVFLPDADAQKVDIRAQAIRHAIAETTFLVDGERCPLSVSIGGAAVITPSDFRTLYRLADGNLYRAKDAGRDCVILDAA